jgi:hypothetical protein
MRYLLSTQQETENSATDTSDHPTGREKYHSCSNTTKYYKAKH